ncbi:MAG: sigma-54 dependent transcriptional regulator [Neisseriaceae bacterium]
MRSTDILVVDDEVGIRDLLSEILQDEGYTVATAENASVARELREQARPAMVLLDIWMPDCDGITLLKEWSNNGLLDMPVVMMSGHGSIDTAVEATRIGALNYLEKPISLQKLLETVQYAMKHNAVQNSNAGSLQKLGKSEKIQELEKELRVISKGHNNVLLHGEVGCSFELVAHFFKPDCGIWVGTAKIAEWLKEQSDWFKNVKNSVVYLGDIEHYNRAEQRKLLDLIRDRRDSHLRFVGYTCQPLENLYSGGKFEPQLIEELCESVVHIPPLRDQLSDLFFLINNLLVRFVENNQVRMVRFSPGALNALSKYNWPGNFEQLTHVVKNLVLNAPEEGLVDVGQVLALLSQFKADSWGEFGGFDFDQPLRDLKEDVERSYFEYHIRQENSNMSQVAQRAGMERTHLYRKLKLLGISINKKK